MKTSSEKCSVKYTTRENPHTCENMGLIWKNKEGWIVEEIVSSESH